MIDRGVEKRVYDLTLELCIARAGNKATRQIAQSSTPNECIQATRPVADIEIRSSIHRSYQQMLRHVRVKIKVVCVKWNHCGSRLHSE